MGKARTRPSTGLRLLDAQTRVVLTGTPYHQDHLRWYAPEAGGPPSQVEVELLPAPIWSSGQIGWWGLEARIDGQRVGELTQPVAGWYRPHLERLSQAGHRAGAEAHVVVGEHGLLEVELYLPVADYLGTYPTELAVAQPARPNRSRVPLWMGVAAAALLLAMVASVAADRISRNDPVTATPAADTRLALAVQTPSPVAPPTEPPPVPVSSPVTTLAAAQPARPVAVRTKSRPKTVAKRVTAAVKPRPTATSSRSTSKPKPTTRESEPTEEPSKEPTKDPTTKPTKPTKDPKPDPEPDEDSDQSPNGPSEGED